jgi:hypothetical protein
LAAPRVMLTRNSDNVNNLNCTDRNFSMLHIHFANRIYCAKMNATLLTICNWNYCMKKMRTMLSSISMVHWPFWVLPEPARTLNQGKNSPCPEASFGSNLLHKLTIFIHATESLLSAISADATHHNYHICGNCRQ